VPEHPPVVSFAGSLETSSEEATAGSWRARALPNAVALVVVVAPLAVAIAHLRPTSDATHDESAIRVIGAGSAGIWRGLDAIIGGVALFLPGWTNVARAEITSAVGCCVAAGLLFTVARRLLGHCAQTTWLGIFVAAIATWTATLGTGWQTEAGAIGGATWGALLPFAMLAALSRKSMHLASFPVAGLACGLAISYEPILAASTLLAMLALVLLHGPRPTRIGIAGGAVLLLVGAAVPIFFSAWRMSVSPFVISAPSLTSGWLGTLDLPQPENLAAFAHSELGWLGLATAGVGLTLAALVPRARPLAVALAVLTLINGAAILLGAPAGPDRYAASPLAVIAAMNLLAAVGMQAAVRAVARANVPLAQASAAMVVVLELTFPAVALDEASLRATDRKNKLGSHWDEIALANLPERSIMLVSDPRVLRHLIADQAMHTMRGDLVIVTLHDIGGSSTLRALAAEPKLAPVIRDVALTGAATEFSLASLAGARPLFVQYDSKWDKSLTRHLVPGGVFDKFEPEPHGVTDRKKALEAFLPLRVKLAREVASPRDVEMTAISASLMHSRLDALMAIDERETQPRAVEDLRAFAPDDPIANRLAFKLIASRIAGRAN